MGGSTRPSGGRPSGRRGGAGRGPHGGSKSGGTGRGTPHRGSNTSGDCCPMVAAARSALHGRFRLAARYARMSVRLLTGGAVWPA